ncbi:DNA polymerase III subunit alpha [Desulfopila sp. IMCC35006]|uniref:DNA polymerase III subunit alpha n=1 Tax=Desulfopila sp. IMCC35006 TaxID=2569542 RepID=UPI0010ABC0C9|nr:DNA polymerase III subunit alpha [Desulfopila sp. IMCC35006]TKB23787.1 DNA polymerase III subunit alpha [Desulfopila sp. IMCC35006]
MFALRVRSYYSLLQGTSSPAALCRQAKQRGYSGLAITDRDNLYGLWDFIKACRHEGLQPIIGAEVSEPGSKKCITCLVQNKIGYTNLCGLLTRRHMGQSFTLMDDVASLATGLLVLCRDTSLLQKYIEQGVQVAADLGACPSGPGRTLHTFALNHGIAAVATADSDMSQESDRQLSYLLQAIRAGSTISRLVQQQMMEDLNWLAGPEAYRHNFAIWPEVVAATEKLCKTCTFTGPDFGVVMPPWWGGEGRQPALVLREKAYRGARRRYGDDLGEPVIERLEHELKVIENMGFSAYFLVVRDIVHRKGADGKRKKRRICGRGSGAASLVAYCLEITNVCPIRYNLYFERFLNPGRTDPPDIDIDFSWDERDEVLADVLQDYAGHAAMVCNHVFFQPRMAIRETAKTFGLPDGEISRLTKRMPWVHSSRAENLEQCLSSLPSLKDQDLSPPWPEVLALAQNLIGVPRYLSVHPGGVIITPEPIAHYVPVERAAKGVPIIQWEKDGAEEAGLVKIDLLGNRSLGVIRDTLVAVRAGGGCLDELTWQPEDDPATRMSVAEGATMGCFYIESPAMRLLEKKAGTGDFEQLVIQSSIIRPAANEFVREYVRRLHGGSWQPLCPQIGDVLDDTFGLMVYQEDVSKVAVALAGFSHSDADGLRKIMSKKDKVHRLQHYKNMFFAGCIRRHVDPVEVERMWQMMMSFDGYSFCKPHSASYARVSFQAAYLKRHYPAEFMAAVIANQGGYYSTFAYVSEAKRLGLKISHPDVRTSKISWTGKKDRILVGLQSVHGLSAGFLDRLVRARDQEPFHDSGDFFRRTQPADNEARALIHAGALDSLHPESNRTALLWQWASFQRLLHDKRCLSLFAAKLPPAPPLPPPDTKSALRREYEILGFLCDCHPVQFLPQQGQGLVKVAALPDRVGQRVQLVAWLLTGKLVSTRTGEVMEFLTFEDETGQLETTFFPEVYQRHAHMLRSGRGYLLTGMVEMDFGALTLTVDTIRSA